MNNKFIHLILGKTEVNYYPHLTDEETEGEGLNNLQKITSNGKDVEKLESCTL